MCKERPGENLAISAFHTFSTESGMTIRCGPAILYLSQRAHMKAIICTVLPKPISSANIPLRPNDNDDDNNNNDNSDTNDNYNNNGTDDNNYNHNDDMMMT